MLLELIASATSRIGSDAALKGNSIRGFYGVAAELKDCGPTAKLLTEVFDYNLVKQSGDWTRFAAADGSGHGLFIDLIGNADGRRGNVAVGSVHHIAFRARTDEEQLHWRERLVELGLHVTPVLDRQYFHSIYFREPGGVLFEIATDGPGFTQDEPLDQLGSKLSLPPWLEEGRSEIERVLPKISVPQR